MKRYQLTIELESDLCVSDGGVYNSYLDTDICYDSYGFPYIPAKRIKGCLRECGLELHDWGMNISVDELFGKKNEAYNRAKVRIGNAYLFDPKLKKDYMELKREAERYAGTTVFHPQNVLNHYSYIRTQTSIDYEKGVADPTTLRTMRVANKGLTFVADVEMEESDSEKYYDAFEACCDTFTNIGIERTRGLGEIRATLKENEKAESKSICENVSHAPYIQGAVELHYELTLEEPIICKSTDGGEAKSLDYIEGSKILGLIANEINRKDRDYISFINGGELFCSNAYLAKNGERCLEVPASCYSVKNNGSIYLEKRNPAQVPEKFLSEQLQLNEMKHCYIRTDERGALIREDVEMEERYHHRRPEDKSIGRAVSDASGDSHLYQTSSIEAGQKFRGFVRGTEDQIRTVYDCLSPLTIVYLGYSHSAEYGRTRIQINELRSKDAEQSKTITDFAVKLDAPALIYGERAFYSTNPKDLDAEIRAVLGLDKEITHFCYVNYTTLGGYNVTWNARKPMVEAFDKGTIVYYHLDYPTTITVPGRILLGERISEGLGEASFYEINELSGIDNMAGKEGKIAGDLNKNEEKQITVETGTLAENLCRDLFFNYVRVQAVYDVNALSCDSKMKNEKARPTISNMLSMCQENTGQAAFFDQMEKNIQDRYLSKSEKEDNKSKSDREDPKSKSDKEDKKRSGRKSDKKNEKLKLAEDILNSARKGCSGLPDMFAKRYHVKGYTCSLNEYAHIYLKSMLQQLKYTIRKQDDSCTNEGEA